MDDVYQKLKKKGKWVWEREDIVDVGQTLLSLSFLSDKFRDVVQNLLSLRCVF